MNIYYSYLSDFSENDFEAFYKYIPKEKAEKLVKVKNYKSKNESLLAWFLLYKAITEKGIEEYSVCFGDDGKPYLKDIPLFFNLSHSNDLVCCAVGEREVGIDAEKIKPVKDALINKVLTENERATLKEKDCDFIRFWTLKESFLKHSGCGITSEIYKLDFSANAEEEEFAFNALYFSVKGIDGYYISVCSEEKERKFIQVKP